MSSIDRQAAIDAMCELMHHWFGGDPKDEVREINRELGKLPSAQPEIIRCKDCKHKPVVDDPDDIGGFQLGFPDGKCPCRCEDDFYSWMPNDDWFCGNAERRTDE